MLRCATRRGATELNHDDPSSFSPPAAFGLFRVLHQIGSGVLGPVFRTYEPERDRLIAVKAFRIDLLPEQASLLATELQKIVEAGLTHPAIVQPVAAGIEGHLPYLAQEYVAAESLDIAMKHYAPAPPARVLPFLRQVAGGIDAAASIGVLHGGLHPRDIFLTTDEARATGFGIVQAIENIGFRAPTRRPYTAPERVNGDEWGVAADVFALGAIAHELLTARRPAGPGDQDGSFAGGVPAEQRALIRDVLARALAEDPGSRFDSATAFVDALEAASAGGRVDPAPVAARRARTAPAAAAPSLFDDAEDTEVDLEPEPVADIPVETTDDVEDTHDVEDVDDVEDEDDIEDTADVEEPAEPAEPDVWPPPGFATGDLDITTEKEADEATGDIDLDLHPAPPVEAPGAPSPDEGAAALEAAEGFAYDTSVEDDEDQPHDEQTAAIPAIPMPPRPVVPAARVEGWRPSASAGVTTAPQSASPLKTFAGVAAGVAVGLLLGWFIFGRSEVLAPGTDQGRDVAGGGAASQTPATEVPVPPPSTPPGAPSTPATDAAPAAPSNGRVLVRSTPTNAMVVIDGVWSGRTPHTKRDLAFGEHTVRVVLEGYEPINRRVTLTPENAAREMTFELRRRAGRRGAAAPQPGDAAPPAGTPAPSANASLSINSRPAGARVMVDGRFVGNTPMKLAGVTPGRHQVRIELEGYVPWSQTVTVGRAQDARVAASLQQR